MQAGERRRRSPACIFDLIDRTEVNGHYCGTGSIRSIRSKMQAGERRRRSPASFFDLIDRTEVNGHY